MLAKLQERLEKGPFETTVGFHGVSVMVTKKVTILSADEIGAMISVKGAFGGSASTRLHPWPSIMFIEF